MSFSATEAAFEGFRLIGRRPASLVLWSLFVLVSCAAMIGLFLVVAWSALADLGLKAEEVMVPADVLRSIAPLGLAVALIVPLALLMNGVLLAALYRAVLQPGKVGFGYLRLGGDELRQVVVILLQFLMAAVFVAVPTAALAWLHAGDFDGLGPGRWLAIVLTGLGVLGLYLWTGVRLSLAGPMTLAAGRVRFFRSWALTRGRFWPLFAMYLLATVLSLVIYFVGAMVAEAVLAAFEGRAAFYAEGAPDLAKVTPQVAGGLAVYLLLQLGLSTLQFAIAYAPQAAAYRDLTRDVA